MGAKLFLHNMWDRPTGSSDSHKIEKKRRKLSEALQFKSTYCLTSGYSLYGISYHWWEETTAIKLNMEGVNTNE